MSISGDEIHGFVYKLLSTSEDAASLTVSKIVEEFKKTFSLDSVNDTVKSQIRADVDELFSSLQQEEDNGDARQKKKNIEKKSKAEKTRRREESEESNNDSVESCDEMEEYIRKQVNKKQKMEESDNSDDFVMKTEKRKEKLTTSSKLMKDTETSSDDESDKPIKVGRRKREKIKSGSKLKKQMKRKKEDSSGNESDLSDEDMPERKRKSNNTKETKRKGRDEILDMLFEDNRDKDSQSSEDEMKSCMDEVALVVDSKTSTKEYNNNKTLKIKQLKNEQEYDETDESDDESIVEDKKRTDSQKKMKIEERDKAIRNGGGCKTSDIDKDDKNLISLKSKLLQFEHSVEKSGSSSDNEEGSKRIGEGKAVGHRSGKEISESESVAKKIEQEKHKLNKIKQSKKTVEISDGSDVEIFDDNSRKSNFKKERSKKIHGLSKNGHDSNSSSDSEENLMSLKSKLKTYEQSVDKKHEKQRESISVEDSSCDDERDSLETPISKTSDDFSHGGKTKRHNKCNDDENKVSSDDEKADKKKRRSRKREKFSGEEKKDSSKLKGLKRYLRACGLHQRYVVLFEDCRSMAAKERKLEKYIRDVTEIEGRITLEKCKKYKMKKEEAEELAELDVNKIIGTPVKGKRVTRQTSSSIPKTTPSSSEVFSSLRDLVDSEESESEKRARKSKKTFVLESDEDD